MTPLFLKLLYITQITPLNCFTLLNITSLHCFTLLNITSLHYFTLHNIKSLDYFTLLYIYIFLDTFNDFLIHFVT